MQKQIYLPGVFYSGDGKDKSKNGFEIFGTYLNSTDAANRLIKEINRTQRRIWSYKDGQRIRKCFGYDGEKHEMPKREYTYTCELRGDYGNDYFGRFFIRVIDICNSSEDDWGYSIDSSTLLLPRGECGVKINKKAIIYNKKV